MLKRKSKLILSCVLTAGMLLSSITGCSSGSSSSNTKSGEKVTLSVMISQDWNTSAMQNVFQRYQDKTGNKLDVQVLPGGSQLNQMILTKAATKDLADLVFLFGTETFLTQIQAPNNLVDLSNEDYISKISDGFAKDKFSFKVDGKFYSLPCGGVNVGGVIYNKDVFTKLNIQIPKTYAEFTAACEKIKQAGITPLYEAGKDAWPLQIFSFNMFASHIYKNPGDIEKLNSNKLKIADIPEFVDILNKQSDLKKKGYINEDVLSGTVDNSEEAVANGKAAMMVQADWQLGDLSKKFPDAKIGMFPIPNSEDGNNIVATTSQSSIGISKNSKNVEAAKSFLSYFASDENLNSYYAELKGISPYKGLKYELNPIIKDMAASVESGKSAPFLSDVLNPSYADLSKIVQMIYMDKYDGKAAATQVDAEREKTGKDQKVPGFN